MISRGQEVIIHLACKDWNRNALESRGWQLSSAGLPQRARAFRRLPRHRSQRPCRARVRHRLRRAARPLLADMNEGLPNARGRSERLDRTDFFLGCVVTNHKRHEREVMPQYFKLRKKAQAGARFVINQIGWDTRKDDELLRWIPRTASLCGRSQTSTCSHVARRGSSARGRSRASSSATSCSSSPSATERARTRAGRSSSSSPPSTSRSRAASASTASTSAGTCRRRPSARSSTWPARSSPTTGASSLARSSFRSPDEFHFFEADPETGLSSTS